jgi:hypothetical protein
VEHPACAYIRQSGCQATTGCKRALSPDFTRKCEVGIIAGEASLETLLLHCEARRIMV